MVNPYLIVASDERLSGGNWSRAVHFQVRVVIFFYKYLQDVQHLDRLKKKSGETVWEARQRGKRGKEILRFGLSLKGLEQINITWTEIPTRRVLGFLWGIISLVLTATAGASLAPPPPTTPPTHTHTRANLKGEHNTLRDIFEPNTSLWNKDQSGERMANLSRLREKQNSLALSEPQTQQRLHHYQLSWAFPKAKVFLLSELVLWDSPQ